MTPQPQPARAHRDVTRAANRLDQAQAALAWLGRQLDPVPKANIGMVEAAIEAWEKIDTMGDELAV